MCVSLNLFCLPCNFWEERLPDEPSERLRRKRVVRMIDEAVTRALRLSLNVRLIAAQSSEQFESLSFELRNFIRSGDVQCHVWQV